MIHLVLFASGGLNIFMQLPCLFSFLVATTACLSLGLLPINRAEGAVTHTVQFRNSEFDPAWPLNALAGCRSKTAYV
jgi:hypothetical protein